MVHYHATQNQPRPVLIGFTSDLDKEFFQKLVTVKDVGPLVAARSLAAPVAEIAAAIARQDEAYLRRMPGIGPQKAEEHRRAAPRQGGQVCPRPGGGGFSRRSLSALPAPTDDEGLRTMVIKVLVKQLGHRPSEAGTARHRRVHPGGRGGMGDARRISSTRSTAGPGEADCDDGRGGGVTEPGGAGRGDAGRASASAPASRRVRRPAGRGWRACAVSVEAARQRREPLDHVCCPDRPDSARRRWPRLWPTRWDRRWPRRWGRRTRGAPTHRHADHSASADVLFIDEIHRLPAPWRS